MDYRDIAERAIWTFVQAFLGAAVIGGAVNIEAGLVAGAAAGVSVLKTAFVNR